MIVINARFLTQRKTGVQQFAINLCRQLNKLRSDIVYIMPDREIEKSLEEEFKPKKVGKHTGHLWEQLELPIYLKKNGSPLLISFSGLSPLLYKNAIYTIHDMSLYFEPRWFKKAYRAIYKINYFFTSRLAHKIITVSQFSKSEIIKYLGCANKKVEVIYNSFDNEMLVDSKVERSVKEHYFLTVGSIEPRKNLSRLINAFASKEFESYKLVIVGDKGKVFSTLNFESNNAENVIFTGYVTEEELISLYKHASFFIYPSVYEGFGIPPLEAMGMGCPVISSNQASMPEVCGNAAIYFDPYNINDIKRAIFDAVHMDEITRSVLIKNGFKRVAAFNTVDEAAKLNKLLMVQLANEDITIK